MAFVKSLKYIPFKRKNRFLKKTFLLLNLGGEATKECICVFMWQGKPRFLIIMLQLVFLTSFPKVFGFKHTLWYFYKLRFHKFFQKYKRTSKKSVMLYRKVCNYRARLRQANQQQAKHDAKWRPILSLRTVLAWKIGLANFQCCITLILNGV